MIQFGLMDSLVRDRGLLPGSQAQTGKVRAQQMASCTAMTHVYTVYVPFHLYNIGRKDTSDKQEYLLIHSCLFMSGYHEYVGQMHEFHYYLSKWK